MESQRRGGHNAAALCKGTAMERADRIAHLTFSKIRLSTVKMRKVMESGREVHKFSVGQPDFPTPDFIVEACRKALADGYTKYPDYAGPLYFRQAVCDKYKRDNGLDYEPDQVLPTCGASMAAYVSGMAFINPGDEVLVPNPMYNIYKLTAEICGAVIKEYSLKEEADYQMDLDQMRELITDKTKMIVICSPCNPTGGVLTRENLEGLADIIGDRDIIIVSDEIYERLTYDGAEAVSPASIPSLKEKTIIINGFSKSFAMTGWRFGYLIAPKHLYEPLYLLAGQITASVPAYNLEAGTVALNEEPKYQSIPVMRDAFDERRKYMVNEINSMKHFSCVAPKGAFYIFMNIKKTGMTSDDFCDWLIENYGLAMVTGACFGSEGEGFARISYASSMDDCRRGMEILRQADDDLTKQGI